MEHTVKVLGILPGGQVSVAVVPPVMYATLASAPLPDALPGVIPPAPPFVTDARNPYESGMVLAPEFQSSA
eukprot:65951-Hanusia_phi.AAC.1